MEKIEINSYIERLPNLDSSDKTAIRDIFKEFAKDVLLLVAENATVDAIDHEEWHVEHLPGHERGTNEVILPVYGVDDRSITELIDSIL